MKKFYPIIFIISLVITQFSAGQPGTLDRAFNGDGKVVTDFNGMNNQGRSVAIQSDHKIVVAGISFNGSNQDFALARYQIDGSLDNSFGENGKVITDIQNNDYVHSVHIQEDGKILVAGHSFTGEDYDVSLVRYESDGSLDTSFGNNGIVIASCTGDDQCRTFGIQADGKIITAGFSNNGTTDFSLMRFSPSGEPDTKFGNNGMVTTEIGDHDDMGMSLFIMEDTRIILAGNYNNGSDLDIALSRYKANGDLDLNFGKEGIVKTKIGSKDDIAHSVVVQNDGKILVAGSTGTDSGRDLLLLRYTSEGIRDVGFGTNGTHIHSLSSGDEYCEGLVVQPDGKMLITGYVSNGEDYDLFVLRCKTDGSPDEAFGEYGLVVTSFGTGQDYGKDIALMTDGRIVVAGFSQSETENDFTVVRLMNDLNVGLIDFTNEVQKINIYPNPVGTSANLRYSLSSEEFLTIKLIDLQGKVLKTFLYNEKKLPGAHVERLEFDPLLMPGNYFLLIRNGKGRIAIQITKL